MKRKKKTHTTRGMRFYYGFVALFSLFLSLYLVSVVNDAFAFVKNDVTVTYTVTEDMSSFDLGKQLKELGILRHNVVFGLYARNTVAAPGDYILSAQMDYEDILDTFADAGAD